MVEENIMNTLVTLPMQEYNRMKDDLKFFEDNRNVKRIRTRHEWEGTTVEYDVITKDDVIEELKEALVMNENEFDRRLREYIKINKEQERHIEAKEIQIKQLINRKWWQMIF
jgi:CobQ-like glutamine amidotransferase family enzyme